MIRAAKYLGVAPWELERAPYLWRMWALTCEAAEAAVQQALSEQQHSG